MKIKLGINYIVTKQSNDSEIKIDNRLRIIHEKKESQNRYSGWDRYVIFTPVRENAPTFFGLPALNHTRSFDKEEDMLKAIEGVEVKLDKEFATQCITDLQKKIDKYKIDYKL